MQRLILTFKTHNPANAKILKILIQTIIVKFHSNLHSDLYQNHPKPSRDVDLKPSPRSNIFRLCYENCKILHYLLYTFRPSGAYSWIGARFYRHVAPLGLYPSLKLSAYTPFVPLELRPLNQKITENPRNPYNPRQSAIQTSYLRLNSMGVMFCITRWGWMKIKNLIR